MKTMKQKEIKNLVKIGAAVRLEKHRERKEGVLSNGK